MDDPTAPVFGVNDVMLGPAACAPVAQKNSGKTVKSSIDLHVRTFIRTSLQGSEVKADRTSLALTRHGALRSDH